MARFGRRSSAARAATGGVRVERVLTVLLLLVAAGACAVVLWAFPRQDRLAQERDARWRAVVGTIGTTELRHWKGRRSSRWELQVWYRYELGGKSYIGRHPTLHGVSLEFTDEHQALHARAAWPDGAEVTVFLDSADPQVSTLDRQWTRVGPIVPWAGLVGVLCLVGAGIVARDGVRAARRSPLPAAAVTRAWVGVRKVCAVLAGGAALVPAVHLTALGFHAAFVQPRLATATPMFLWDPDVHGNPPTPVSKYRFRPDGQETWFEGTAWRFGRTAVPTWEDAEREKERLVAAHREGTLAVHYLPGDPSACALTPGHGGVVPPTAVFGASVVAGLLAPLALVSAGVVRRRAAASRATAPRPREAGR